MSTPKVVNLRRDQYTVYIGRPGRGQPRNVWGNPFPIGQPVSERHLELLGARRQQFNHLKGRAIDRTLALEMYEALLRQRLSTGELNPGHFIELDGETLGCFCAPQPCHGDIIARFTDWYLRQPQPDELPPSAQFPDIAARL